MNQFDYKTYAEAIHNLAVLPNELERQQELAKSAFIDKTRQVDSAIKVQINELNKVGNIAFQQFDDIAYTYKILFSVPVSRPEPVPTPLSVKEAISAQNTFAIRLKSLFDKEKQAEIEKKRLRIESEKADRERLAAIKAQEEENRKKQALEEEKRREDIYRQELELARREFERANRSILKKIIDLIAGN